MTVGWSAVRCVLSRSGADCGGLCPSRCAQLAPTVFRIVTALCDLRGNDLYAHQSPWSPGGLAVVSNARSSVMGHRGAGTRASAASLPSVGASAGFTGRRASGARIDEVAHRGDVSYALLEPPLPAAPVMLTGFGRLAHGPGPLTRAYVRDHCQRGVSVQRRFVVSRIVGAVPGRCFRFTEQ